jgi:hypothetical protein
MTPTSNKPLNKVTYGAVAAAVATIVIALLRHYIWPDMPADLDAPLNTVVVALVAGLASGVTGYMTKLQPGEVKAADATEAGRHGTGV